MGKPTYRRRWRRSSSASSIQQPSSLLYQVKLWAVLTAIIAPGAFLIGTYYYEGYVEAFGVRVEDLPVSTSVLYVHAYKLVGLFLLKVAEALVSFVDWQRPLLMLAYVAVGWVGLYGLLRLIRWLANLPHHHLLNRFVRWLHPSNNDVTLVSIMTATISYVVLLLLTAVGAMALFWWQIPLSASKQGHEDAQEKISDFNALGCRRQTIDGWGNCVKITDAKGKVLYEGVLVGSTDKSIVLYTAQGAKVMPRKSDWYLLHERINPNKGTKPDMK